MGTDGKMVTGDRKKCEVRQWEKVKWEEQGRLKKIKKGENKQEVSSHKKNQEQTG